VVMQKVFSSSELSNAAIVRDLLVSNGISANLVNENAAGTMVVGAGIVLAEVWVNDEEKVSTAQKLIREYQSDESHKIIWSCQSCKEENPGSFSICWNCGGDRYGPAH
jgi:hypothetical protein